MLPDTWRVDFESRGPWTTRFTIEGQSVGGNYDDNGRRVQQFHQAFPEARRILELGSLEGAHSFALAALPATEQVVAIEGRQDNFERAMFVKGLLDQWNVLFLQADLERFPLRSLGHFDAIYCVGLLYHLPNPWFLLHQLSSMSDRLFLWTHYSDTEETTVNGYKGRWYGEHGLADPLSGLSARSFWPTRVELLRLLENYGFGGAAVIHEEATNGARAITLAAVQDVVA